MRGVLQWWQRRAELLAAVFAVQALTFAVVAVVQGAMLRSQGWDVPLGNVAEWVAAGGSLAAFGALFYAAREWRTGQAERRDHEADQARLIGFEPTILPQPDEPPEQAVLVHNQSGLTLIDLVVANVVDGQVGAGRMMYPYLSPGGRTQPFPLPSGIEASMLTARDYYAANFTDAHGRRWCRVGRRQPAIANRSPIGRQIDEQQSEWLPAEDQ